MGLKRRTFLKFSAAGVVLAGLGAVWFSNESSNRAAFIRAILNKRLGHKLTLDEEGVDRFIEVFQEEVARQGGMKFKIMASLYPAYVYSGIFEIPLTRDALWWIERDVVSAFLMGSDFFYDVAAYEAGEPLVFVELHDQVEQPCGNPFGITT